jgi:hypothetical protein
VQSGRLIETPDQMSVSSCPQDLTLKNCMRKTDQSYKGTILDTPGSLSPSTAGTMEQVRPHTSEHEGVKRQAAN